MVRQCFDLGAATFAIACDVPAALDHVAFHYGGLTWQPGVDVADFHVAIRRRRRALRADQAVARIDFPLPFVPAPLRHSASLLESAMNWLVAMHGHTYLALHAGCVARGRRAVLLPGQSGSGKSTLSAALMLRGWRLLSDEFGLLRPDDGCLAPFSRPVSVKNDAIEVLARWSADAQFGARIEGLAKGTVAFLRVAPESLADRRPARPRLIAFPR